MYRYNIKNTALRTSSLTLLIIKRTKLNLWNGNPSAHMKYEGRYTLLLTCLDISVGYRLKTLKISLKISEAVTTFDSNENLIPHRTGRTPMNAQAGDRRCLIFKLCR